MSPRILETIVAAHYLATEAQVEQLASLSVNGQRAGGTYLGVLIAHVREGVTGDRKPTRAQGLALINAAHKKLYAAVLRGVGDESMPAVERNRRATFARTATADLRYFVSKGGDLRKLEPGAVSKLQLRRVGRAVPTGTRAERSLGRALDVLTRSAQRIAKTDAKAAAKKLRAAVSDLEALLELIEGERKQPKREPAARITRARLHRTQIGGESVTAH